MKRQFLPWLTSGLLVLAALPVSADCPDPCAISTLRPGALSARLPITNLFPNHLFGATEVIVQPRFGTLEGHLYSPGPDFWLAGTDLIRIRQGATGEVGTVIVRVAELTSTFAAHEDFEINPIGNLQLPWIDEGSLGSLQLTPHALEGQWSLAIDLTRSLPDLSLDQGPGQGMGGNGQGHMGVAVTINNQGPDDPWQQNDFEAVLINILGAAGVNLKRENGVSAVHAWASQELGCDPSCYTPWQTITDDQTYHLLLSLGRNDLEDPTGDWSLTLAIDAADGSWHSADELFGLSLLNVEVVTATGLLSGTPSGTLVIDDATSWSGSLDALPGLRFEEFDGSWSSAWSTQGWVWTAATQTDFGSSGAIFLSNPTSGSTSGWIDSEPSSSRKVTARAHVDLGGLTLPPGSTFQLFSGTNSENSDVFNVVVEVQPDGTAKAQVQLRRPDGDFAASGWASIDPSGIDDIAVAWNADGGDSVARLWVGQQYRDVEVAGAGLGVTVENLSIGAKFLKLAAPTKSGGTLQVDDVLLSY